MPAPGGISLAMLAFLAMAAAEPPATVNEVVVLVREGLAAHRDDKQLAKALSKVKLAESLAPYVVEELESAGAGPKTVQELDRLREISENLPLPAAPPKFAEPPLPSPEEMRAAIRKARVYAINYTAHLPDFLCNETVERFQENGGKGHWDKQDVLGVKLSYLDHAEDYRLMTMNGRPTTRNFDSILGARSEGEFGTMLLEVFLPNSHAEFQWDHWTHLHKRPIQVYSYRIKVDASHYEIVFGTGSGKDQRVVGLEGVFYLDAETNVILRLTNRAVDIPIDFQVRQSETVLDYAPQDVGGKQYILPVHAEVRMGTGYIHTKNEVTFTGFHKFQGESTITFDTDANDKAAKAPIKH